MSGVDLISAERERQLERWDADHDDEHENGSLALVAALYATPIPLYRKTELAGGGVVFSDAWPWDDQWDKRKRHSRIRNLFVAGALIAAEIDRLERSARQR